MLVFSKNHSNHSFIMNCFLSTVHKTLVNTALLTTPEVLTYKSEGLNESIFKEHLSKRSSSEACLSIVCACIPTLRPLYLRLAHGTHQWSDDRPYTRDELPQRQAQILNELSGRFLIILSSCAQLERGYHRRLCIERTSTEDISTID